MVGSIPELKGHFVGRQKWKWKNVFWKQVFLLWDVSLDGAPLFNRTMQSDWLTLVLEHFYVGVLPLR